MVGRNTKSNPVQVVVGEELCPNIVKISKKICEFIWQIPPPKTPFATLDEQWIPIAS